MLTHNWNSCSVYKAGLVETDNALRRGTQFLGGVNPRLSQVGATFHFCVISLKKKKTLQPLVGEVNKRHKNMEKEIKVFCTLYKIELFWFWSVKVINIFLKSSKRDR